MGVARVIGAAMAEDGGASPFWEFISQAIGWLYFLAWTISFWPQTLLIYRRKSVEGVSLDFLALNALGFLCYSIFQIAFLVSPDIQQQYRDAHGGQENLVRWNDAFFALHAFLLACFQLGCAFVYKRAPGQTFNPWVRITVSILSALPLLALAACVVGGGQPQSQVTWLDFVNLCSYVKLVITMLKYAPQIVLNYERKSTLGFAIEGILLDMTGGLLSLLQLVIDAQLINHDWTDVTGNPGKLGLSFISIFFDVFLIVQHYCLYGGRAVEGESNVRAGILGGQRTSPEDEDSGHGGSSDPERRPLLS